MNPEEIEVVVNRLKKDQDEGRQAGKKEGTSGGERWAKTDASLADLRRVADSSPDLSGGIGRGSLYVVAGPSILRRCGTSGRWVDTLIVRPDRFRQRHRQPPGPARHWRRSGPQRFCRRW